MSRISKTRVQPPCQRHVAGRDGQRACQLASTPDRRPRLVVRLGAATTWAGLVSLGGGRMWGHVSSRQGPVRSCQCHVACLLGQPVPACVGARLWQDSSSDWALQRGQSWRGQSVGACLRKTDEVPRATSPSCARQALGACRLGVCVVCVVCVCVCVVGPARDG